MAPAPTSPTAAAILVVDDEPDLRTLYGLALLHSLRAQQRGERCIVMTAYGSAENAVEALKAGAFDYLTKPVDLKQFRAVVASAVQAQQALPAKAWQAAPADQ